MTQQPEHEKDVRKPPATVDLGWGATPISEQFDGFVAKSQLAQFDADSMAVSRLRLRGYLTDSAHRVVVNKLTNALAKALRDYKDRI
jgi:hypothetical protein